RSRVSSLRRRGCDNSGCQRPPGPARIVTTSQRRNEAHTAEAFMARIVLSGVDEHFPGRTWESPSLLRIGRLEQLDVVLARSSVSRYHAEIRMTERGWRRRD